VAGKTGTAQVQGKEPTSVFVAWAPADNPQYLVVVIEEQAGYGASAAAPVARRILEGLYGQTTPPPVYISNAARN
jgi:penicillin-binding protein 2